MTVDGVDRQVSGGAPVTVGPWHHVALTYDGMRGILTTYVDGIQAAQDRFDRGMPGASTGDLLIGPAGSSSDDAATLALDEVSVSRVVRDEDEIAFAASGTEMIDPRIGGAELLQGIEMPLGLDPSEVIIPVWAPARPEVVALGEMLFFDPRLSGDGSRSCATCHDPQHAWTDGRATALAIDGSDLPRATPTIFNRALSTKQFWDGRARSVESQALSPIGSPREMNLPLTEAVARLQSSPGYVEMFQAAWGRGPTRNDLANAIAAFERAQLAGDSPVDRFEAGELDALTEAEQRGGLLFHGKARCAACHSGSNYTDEAFHKSGLLHDNDRGRYFVSGGRTTALRSFKTPTLRNVDVTGPYFHDGSVATLEEVVALYDAGSSDADHDWEIRPLGLTADEQADLVAFLRALTSPNAVSSFSPDLPDMPGF